MKTQKGNERNRSWGWKWGGGGGGGGRGGKGWKCGRTAAFKITTQ